MEVVIIGQGSKYTTCAFHPCSVTSKKFWVLLRKLGSTKALLPELFTQAEPSSFCAIRTRGPAVCGATTCMSQTNEVRINQSNALCHPSYFKSQRSLNDLVYM